MAVSKRKIKEVQSAPVGEALLSISLPAVRGRDLRDQCPRRSHADWSPQASRPDPVAIIEESSRGRLPELIPIRYGRMIQSPLTFFRGAPAIMAADLAHTPTTGVHVQVCGDCHLLNFGGFATPERRLVFDINDFDETLPAPWEWDLKRLVASFVIAARVNRFSAAEARTAALACVRSYRKRMAEFARMRMLDVWYARIDLRSILDIIREDAARRRLKKQIEKARKFDVVYKGFPKLTYIEGGRPVIRDKPPFIYHRPEDRGEQFAARMMEALDDYCTSLPAERRPLIDQYRLRDIAIKVVGVGSVGTLCAVMLLTASRPGDHLFLQVKEARTSVLEPYAKRSTFSNRGERVVTGQRLMQSASDVFLGWTKGAGERHFYVRQLRDVKLKPLVELFTPSLMLQYAKLCGWTLARAHARSGRQAMISDYLGRRDRFDEALAEFAVAYADQNDRDYGAFVEAARSGRIEARLE